MLIKTVGIAESTSSKINPKAGDLVKVSVNWSLNKPSITALNKINIKLEDAF